MLYRVHHCTYWAWYPPQSGPQVPSMEVPIKHLVPVSSKFTNLTSLTLNPWPKGRTIPVLVPVPAPFGASSLPSVEWAGQRKINQLMINFRILTYMVELKLLSCVGQKTTMLDSLWQKKNKLNDDNLRMVFSHSRVVIETDMITL